MSAWAKANDRAIKMHIVSRDLRIIQGEKKDYNKWMLYIRRELEKMKINKPLY